LDLPHHNSQPNFRYGHGLDYSVLSLSHRAVLLQWALNRRHLFPNATTEARRHQDGSTLIHVAWEETSLKTFLDIGLDWRVKNYDGRNALEHFAYRRSQALPFLLHTLSDAEFRTYATKDIWARIELFTHDQYKSQLTKLLVRLVTTMPGEHALWKELLRYMIHVNLRRSRDHMVPVILNYAGVEAKMIGDLAIVVLMEPFDPPQCFGPYPKNLGKYPTPHLLVTAPNNIYIVPTVTREMRRRIAGREFDEYFNTRDHKGRTPLELAKKQNPGKGFEISRLEAAIRYN